MGTKLASSDVRNGFCTSFVRYVGSYFSLNCYENCYLMASMGCFVGPQEGGATQRVAAMQFSAALGEASRCMGDEHVGLRVGMGMKPSHLGAFGYAAMTARDGISAVRLYEELQQLLMTELAVQHEARGALTEFHLSRQCPLPGDYPFWSFMLAFRLNYMRFACGQRIVPVAVSLPCPPPQCEHALRVFVGAPVYFNASAYSECYQTASLIEPNPHSSPEIHGVMATMARREWRESFVPQERMVAQLKEAILQDLQRGANPTLHSLVSKLPRNSMERCVITARQLQRKLAERQHSFRDLVAEVRKERALAQLQSTDRPLADIAAEAGYAELSSFHRAVRRWTGLTPMRIRKQGVGNQEA